LRSSLYAPGLAQIRDACLHVFRDLAGSPADHNASRDRMLGPTSAPEAAGSAGADMRNQVP
jgi:hypothetical protein